MNPRPSRERTGFAWCMAAGCVLWVLSLGCAGSHRPPRAQPNQAAPEFVANDLHGRGVRSTTLGRNNVVILFLWAAWDCADELPALDAVASRLSRQQATVLAVSIDRDVDVLKGVVSSRAGWQLVFLHDPTGQVAELYNPSGFPAAYVIDRSGTIRHVHHGVRTVDMPSIEAQARALK